MRLRIAKQMGIIWFKIAGLMGQPRPRFSTANGRVRTYDLDKAVSYKEEIGLACRVAGQKSKIKLPIDASDKGIGVKILACYQCPKSFSKSKTAEALTGNLKPTKKPDADNIAKIVLDGLNGIMWKDDNQVTRLEIEKAYTDKDPYVIIEVAW